MRAFQNLRFHLISKIIFLLLFAYSLSVRSEEIQTTESAIKNGSAGSIAPAPRVAPPRPLRLPNTTYPLHYAVHIFTDIHLEDFNYKGNVTLDIEVRESTNEIVMHSKNLNVTAITLRDLVTQEIMDDITYSYELHGSLLIIHPIENYQAFEAGQKFRLEILFAGVMNAKTFGIYWLTYQDINNRTVYLAATQFEPTSARLAFPCYDEPAFKSNFTLRITHGSRYMAIANMPVHDVFVHDEQSYDKSSSNTNNNHLNGKATTTFYTTPPMSTYLVAFVISDFQYISEEYRGVTQRIFTSSNNQIDKGQKALKNAMRTLAAFEDYFGIDYPLAKLDHIALQKNYGSAMENWGLITYKEDSLVQQQDDDDDMHKKLKDILTQNHELAHQWFGNLVSPVWWTYAWLNEGFATYFSYLITDTLYPEFKAMEFFLTDIAERAYSYNYMTVRPMTYYVERESEIMSVFDIITYQRAACVIKMFHHAFNQKTFVRGISKYLRKFQYSVANEMQLFDTMQATISEDELLSQEPWSKSVQQILLSWTHSEWIPIVTIIRNYENNTITIRQRSKDLRSMEHWWVPVNFATASKPDFQQTHVEYFMAPVSEVTINPSDLGITLNNDDWLIVNKQQTGFYHVLYDDENLMRIAKVLQENHTTVHPLNRGVIFQDLCPLIENNEIQNVDVVFELLKYLQYEKELLPWNLVTDTIEFFERNLYGTASYVLYQQFIQSLITPIFNQLFATQSYHGNMTNTELLARQNIMHMACSVDVQDCLDFTRTLAHAYVFRNAKVGKRFNYYRMHDSIMCLGVKYLSDEEFNSIMALLSSSDQNKQFYDDMIYSLRCTQSRSHLRHYLDVIFGNNSTERIMNDSESMMYLFYLYKSNLAARPVVWHFFERHYKILCRSPYFADNFNRISEYIPRRHHDDFRRLRDLVALELTSMDIDVNKTLISADSDRIGKKVRISEEFLNKFGHHIHEWLFRNQAQRPAYAAASFVARNTANQIGSLFHSASKFFSKMLRNK